MAKKIIMLRTVWLTKPFSQSCWSVENATTTIWSVFNALSTVFSIYGIKSLFNWNVRSGCRLLPRKLIHLLYRYIFGRKYFVELLQERKPENLLSFSLFSMSLTMNELQLCLCVCIRVLFRFAFANR